MAGIAAITQFHDDLRAWRHQLHAHPELGFEEQRTSEFVAQKLAQFGCEVFRGLGRTGVVGRLRAGRSEHTIGLRADMDALPIAEASDLPYRSQNQGRMHACGHGGHTAMLLGAARYLAATRNFDGVVHFIFQPAEEGLGGAAAMLADGLFERFPCDAVFGMHNWPGLATGRFRLRTGPMWAGGIRFDINVSGRGAHAARPEAGIDPVIVASHIALALQTIVSRNLRPLDTAVVSVTQIHAGEAYNVIPGEAVLRGTARAFSEATMDAIEDAIRRLAPGVAAAFGAAAAVEFRRRLPALVNDKAQAAFAADVAAELVGEGAVERDGEPAMVSEDLALMLGRRPGAYLQIGNGAGEAGSGLHHPRYDFNDAILPLGASLYARLAERKLARN